MPGRLERLAITMGVDMIEFDRDCLSEHVKEFFRTTLGLDKVDPVARILAYPIFYGISHADPERTGYYYEVECLFHFFGDSWRNVCLYCNDEYDPQVLDPLKLNE